jgi:hypothetical protein
MLPKAADHRQINFISHLPNEQMLASESPAPGQCGGDDAPAM